MPAPPVVPAAPVAAWSERVDPVAYRRLLTLLLAPKPPEAQS